MRQCPVCNNTGVLATRSDLMPHPYVQCSFCGLLYQVLNEKVYMAVHEPEPSSMSDYEKAVNASIADWLFSSFLNDQEPYSINALDIGGKFPWMMHCLGLRGVNAYAIDGIPDIETLSLDLKVAGKQCDFEQEDLPWNIKFDLISMVHVIEHLYFPIRSLTKVFNSLKEDGLFYVRCPLHDVQGIERDFTEGHFTIHPQIWSEQSLRIMAEKIGFDIVYRSAMQGAGQGDFILKKRRNKPFNLGVGLIVKNEEKDLPECLNSVKNIADCICIIDTGSTDNTSGVVYQFAKEHGFFVQPLEFSNEITECTTAKILLYGTYLDASELIEAIGSSGTLARPEMSMSVF